MKTLQSAASSSDPFMSRAQRDLQILLDDIKVKKIIIIILNHLKQHFHITSLNTDGPDSSSPPAGSPPGSVLGPLLFVFCLNDMITTDWLLCHSNIIKIKISL